MLGKVLAADGTRAHDHARVVFIHSHAAGQVPAPLLTLPLMAIQGRFWGLLCKLIGDTIVVRLALQQPRAPPVAGKTVPPWVMSSSDEAGQSSGPPRKLRPTEEAQ
eukprot:6142236-Amphidinium_carterae.2